MNSDNRNSSALSLITIYEISKILGSTLNLEKSLFEVLNVLSSYLQMRRGMISLAGDNGQLEIMAAQGLAGNQYKKRAVRLAQGVTGKILSSGMPMVIPNLADEPLFVDHDAPADTLDGEVVSFIGVPIKTQDVTFGVLSIDRVWEAEYNNVNFEADVRFLTMVANLIAQTVRLNHSVANERERLILEKHRLQKALTPQREGNVSLTNVVGTSRRMQEIYSEIKQIAPSRSTVLLRGESGTGKELIARAIHYLSQRKDGPFIKLNCAALPETLLESELFGHEKGSFTGATAERKGRFEQANGGTFFLDEIGEISAAFQAKLLRVLQEGEFERVGGNKTLKVDVRLVCATNKNLEEAVTRGEFRADLYFRINVVPVFLPPLRDRKEDIPLLAQHFLDRFNDENGRALAFAPEAVRVLQSCYFPGNVRELENCINRAGTMCRTDLIRDVDMACQKNLCLSSQLWKHKKATGLSVASAVEAVAPHPEVDEVEADDDAPLMAEGAFDDATPATQRERLLKAMEKAGWVQAKAARLLGLTPRQIGYALKKYNIEVKKI